jgi:Cu/Ag efflux pump CusA
MEDRTCQEDTLQKLEELKNNLIFILCRPYKEYYYSYSINNINNYRIIKQDELKSIINNLSKENISKTEMLFNKHRSFIFFKEQNSIEEVNPYEGKEIEKLLAKNQINKELKNKIKEVKQSRYESMYNEIKDRLKFKVKDNRRFVVK